MLRKAIDEQFIEIVDDLVMMSESDADLAEGIRWIDSQSQKNGLTFYEMVYIVTEKHMAEEKAKQWLSKKSTASRKKLMYV
ncbi:MAG TPA: hypothetical protein VE622_05020 [Nitrososphaeraceae archaeon]|jgi:hypothetical protein|nr:hypothetical protein [Nitrososphaeraceae archaeon]